MPQGLIQGLLGVSATQRRYIINLVEGNGKMKFSSPAKPGLIRYYEKYILGIKRKYQMRKITHNTTVKVITVNIFLNLSTFMHIVLNN